MPPGGTIDEGNSEVSAARIVSQALVPGCPVIAYLAASPQLGGFPVYQELIRQRSISA